MKQTFTIVNALHTIQLLSVATVLNFGEQWAINPKWQILPKELSPSHLTFDLTQFLQSMKYNCQTGVHATTQCVPV